MRYIVVTLISFALLTMSYDVSWAAEKRVALVIGNAAYSTAPLKNPVNDARAMAEELRKVGFEVVDRYDLKARNIGSTLREFRSRLRPGAEALFFYAGHGIQIRGVNYLPAVDADILSEEDAPLQSMDVNKILELMEESKTQLNLMFLDACRNNPYSRKFRSAGDGLAKVDAPSGTLISFATRPGSTASDGDGKHGLYTKHLLSQINRPGIPIEQALKMVIAGVKTDSMGAQEPWMEGSIQGDFFFIPTAVTVINVASQVADHEEEAWKAANSVGTQNALELFVKEYPRGRFATAARIKLTSFDKQGEAVTAGSTESHAAKPTKVRKKVNAGQVFKDCEDCPEMVVIPTGSFQMGSENGEKNERPAHLATFSRPFAIGKTEVTERQWKAIMFDSRKRRDNCDDCPLKFVTWADTQAFIERLNAKTGFSYRLPSEAEWEYTCRAGGQYEFCGSDNPDEVAWHRGNSFDAQSGHKWEPRPVAGKAPNKFGVHDMSGNVDEWVADCWHDNYIGAPADGSVWYGGDCGIRVVRGGDTSSDPKSSRAMTRTWLEIPNTSKGYLGFRLATDMQ